MWSYIKNPDVWIPLLAVLISIVALWQTNRQIKLSNKQQLFDRRLGNYLIIEGLFILFTISIRIITIFLIQTN